MRNHSQFLASMHERGIRLIERGLWYVSAAHTESEIDQAVSAARETLTEMMAAR